MPYTVVQALLDPSQPPGRRNYWKAENMEELSDEAIDTLVDPRGQDDLAAQLRGART